MTEVSLRIEGKHFRENFHRKFRKPGSTDKCDSDLPNNKIEGISWTLRISTTAL